MTFDVRPTVPDDLAALTSEPLPFRIKAMTAIKDGRVIGIAGIGYMPNGTIVALAQMTDEARMYRFTLHRAALRFLAGSAASGIREIVTLPDTSIAGAENWLRHLGFEPQTRNGERVYVWQTRSH